MSREQVSVPEPEVQRWETLVVCYRAYTEPKELADAQKKLALNILLMIGMGEDLRELAADFACVPEGAKEAISAMLGPQPNQLARARPSQHTISSD